ncbi:MAG: hypothetical protein KDA41_17565 [Planctomycetales bacterium]|nr:hypothetical protein [Planctomycetales bacterium]
MQATRQLRLGAASLLLVAFGAAIVLSQAETIPLPQRRAAAHKLMNEGNWRDAYDSLKVLIVDADSGGREASDDLQRAIQCLHRLGRIEESGELLESAVAAHPADWRVLQATANQYLSLPHQGFLIAGDYVRGGHRGGGKAMQSLERDRVRAMQLMTLAMPLADRDDDKQAVSTFYMNLANQLL